MYKPMDDEHLEMNRRAWDARTPLHSGSAFYDIEGVVSGRTTLHPFEPTELGDVSGCSLLHLQCHLGIDTISWARRGASVTGLDFSPAAIETAQRIAVQCGLKANFVLGNVYDAVEILNSRFDIVYTGLGALCWLKDILAWSQVVSDLLVPGGRLFLLEFHPILSTLSDDGPFFDPSYPYFWREEGVVSSDGDDYAEGVGVLDPMPSIEWPHPIGDVVTALIGAGLEIQLLKEHDVIAYAPWQVLERVPGEAMLWRLPENQPQIPLEYSLRAIKRG